MKEVNKLLFKTNLLESVGQRTLRTVKKIGVSFIFLIHLLCHSPCKRYVWTDVRYQIYFLGVLSFVIIVVSALFIGMVVGLQGFHTLEKFGATTQLGQLLALSITRELSPVLTALLFAGRAGSALTAEIGLMKATEQLDSMDMMGVSPMDRVVYPRFIAGIIALPMLTLIFSVAAILGGYLVGVVWLGLDAGTFWSNMQNAVHFRSDIFTGILKSIVFGFIVVWISVFQGYDCVPTAAGISDATTRTVVYGSLAVLGFDFILTTMMMGAW